MKNFVDFIWLKNELYTDNLVILDARGDLQDPLKGIDLYFNGHIPTAQYVSLDEVMTGEIKKHGGRHPLPNLDEFVEKMKGLGIEDDSRVVIYDDGNLHFVGRLWWLLKYIGKEEVYVLKGGYDSWVRQDGDITETSPTVNKSDNLSVNINDDIRVDMEYVRDSIGNENTVLVDSRAYGRYIGEIEPFDKIPGHIPGAVNFPYNALLQDGEVPTSDEIKNHFKDLKKYDEIIVYCGSGVTATVNYLLLDEIGLNPKLYPGSYSDWISYEENAVEKGE